MYTAQQVADQINQTKPDISNFLKLLSAQKLNELYNDIASTNDIYIKLLKAQITLIHYKTHSRAWGGKFKTT